MKINKENFLKMFGQYFEQPVLMTDDREIAFRCVEYLGSQWAVVLYGKSFEIKRIFAIADIHTAANGDEESMRAFYRDAERAWTKAFSECQIIHSVMSSIKRDKPQGHN
jgi:hypothetical protein